RAGIEPAEIGPAGGQDGVHLVEPGDVAADDHRDPGLVADAVGQAGVEQPPVVGGGVGDGVAGGDVDQVGSAVGQAAGEDDAVGGGQPTGEPVVGHEPHGQRPPGRPGLPNRGEDL